MYDGATLIQRLRSCREVLALLERTIRIPHSLLTMIEQRQIQYFLQNMYQDEMEDDNNDTKVNRMETEGVAGCGGGGVHPLRILRTQLGLLNPIFVHKYGKFREKIVKNALQTVYTLHKKLVETSFEKGLTLHCMSPTHAMKKIVKDAIYLQPVMIDFVAAENPKGGIIIYINHPTRVQSVQQEINRTIEYHSALYPLSFTSDMIQVTYKNSIDIHILKREYFLNYNNK